MIVAAGTGAAPIAKFAGIPASSTRYRCRAAAVEDRARARSSTIWPARVSETRWASRSNIRILPPGPRGS